MLATSAPRLRSLNLSGVRLRGCSVAAAAKLTALTHLRLGILHVSTVQDMPCLLQLTRLETLHLNLRSGYVLQVWKDVALRYILSSTPVLYRYGCGTLGQCRKCVLQYV